ncbi:uncharacterized protein TRIADDRAFT_53566 [Trichoplax adhaerens]|uniref:HMG box domain-containing protein n=1 Tax=Trichoplax adhaerens TaxID=10228 RepID=B3RPJ8_TRIAD|nr:hypothetical protein TRIADDRAFT_53566 [Trichoplax adhaerens]EDV27647.1 hypothetical protein TRIADDRAFT_53566 [Trichoplax adhaerens]|eukprot:XP_002109481.1 hypothetical protein TRIADDRAFT_53566 [Trichoplax adhaerens]
MALQYSMRQDRPINVQQHYNVPNLQPVSIASYNYPYQSSPDVGKPVQVNQSLQWSSPQQLQAPPRYQIGVTQPRMEPTKPPKAPEKPLMPYMRYSSKMFEKVKEQHPDLKLWEIGKMIGAMWRNLDDKQKQEYFDDYEKDKRQYNESVKAYQQSPEYQAWVISKARNNAPPIPNPNPNQNPKPQVVRSAQDQQIYDKAMQHAAPSAPLPEPPISMQIIEDESEENELTEQHIAAARFYRNNILMNEIFSDTAAREPSSGATDDRVKILRDRQESLKQMQKKQEKELQELQEKFEQKKRKYVENDEKFRNKLKELRSKKEETHAALKKAS